MSDNEFIEKSLWL